MTLNNKQRFWTKVNVNGPVNVAPLSSRCWIWTGKITKNGYPEFYLERKYRLAHRLSYMMAHGPIPENYQIDHLCKVTACVNPDHLEAVTGKVNLHRSNALQAQNARKTHCIRGHAFTPENTGRVFDRTGYKRVCKECARLRARRYRRPAEEQK